MAVAEYLECKVYFLHDFMCAFTLYPAGVCGQYSLADDALLRLVGQRTGSTHQGGREE